jgi:hypothetical protein
MEAGTKMVPEIVKLRANGDTIPAVVTETCTGDADRPAFHWSQALLDVLVNDGLVAPEAAPRLCELWTVELERDPAESLRPQARLADALEHLLENRLARQAEGLADPAAVAPAVQTYLNKLVSDGDAITPERTNGSIWRQQSFERAIRQMLITLEVLVNPPREVAHGFEVLGKPHGTTFPFR